MSGRIATIILLLACAMMIATALWVRSRDTAHVRAFWSPQGAALIQHATKVEVRGVAFDPVTHSGLEPWHDVSAAPGLVHVRSTLVEDKYFHWPSSQSSLNIRKGSELPSGGEPTEAGSNTAATAGQVYQLAFSQGDIRLELAVEIDSGWVTNLQTMERARLIESSRKALAAYFRVTCDSIVR